MWQCELNFLSAVQRSQFYTIAVYLFPDTHEKYYPFATEEEDDLVTVRSFSDAAESLKSTLVHEEAPQTDDWDSEWSWDEKPDESVTVSLSEPTSVVLGTCQTDVQHPVSNSFSPAQLPNEVRVRSVPSIFQDCLVASSIDFECVVLASETRFVILNRAPHAPEISEKFMVELPDTITAVCCIPIAATRATSAKSYDWVCILIGLDNGTIWFYTDHGVAILKHRFVASEVKSIALQCSFQDIVELSIAHADSTICLVDAVSLLSALKASKTHVARHGSLQGIENLISLEFKKLLSSTIPRQCRQHVACGPTRENSFDQLLTASTTGGFEAHIDRNLVPKFTVFAIGGQKPFLNYYFWDNSVGDGISMGKVVTQLAGKVKNAVGSQVPVAVRGIGSLFGFGEDKSKKLKPEDVKPSLLRQRFSIDDSKREFGSIVVSPSGHLGVSTDSLGRVFLIDMHRGHIVRLWKGYRDAQCAFHAVKGKNEGGVQTAIFLIIFAPKRGILEVWAMQNGPRIYGFNVDKNGILIQDYHFGRILGSNCNPMYSNCAFIDHSGVIKQLKIPFHLVLQDQTINRQHDLNVMKSFQLRIKNFEQSQENLKSLLSLVSELRTLSSQRDAFDFVLLHLADVSSSGLNQTHHFSSFLDCLISQVRAVESVDWSVDHQKLLLRFLIVRQLLNAFALVRKMDSVRDPCVDLDSKEDTSTNVATLLSVDRSTLDRYMKLLDLVNTPDSVTSNADDMTIFGLGQFLQCFDCHTVNVSNDLLDAARKSNFEMPHLAMKLKTGMAEKLQCQLGGFIFYRFLTGAAELRAFELEIEPVFSLEFDSWMDVFLSFWLSDQHCGYSVDPRRLYQLLKCLLDTKRSNWSRFEWLAKVEVSILKSERIAECFALAIVVRGLLTHVDSFDGKSPDSPTTGADWDVVAVPQERWDSLIGIVALLLKLYRLCHTCYCLADDMENTPSYVKPLEVSVSQFILTGRGYFSELIGRWFVEQKLTLLQLMSVLNVENSISVPEQDGQWKRLLVDLVIEFPISLTADDLLANCAWEQAAKWQKDPADMGNLESSVEFVSAVSNPVVQHGIAFLMWKTFAEQKFNDLARLVVKVGRIPKDRISRQKILLPETRVILFCQSCVSLLNVIMESSRQFEAFSTPKINTETEDFMENFFTLFSTQSKPGSPGDLRQGSHNIGFFNDISRRNLVVFFVVDMAYRERCTNFHLVEHTAYFALSIQLLMEVTAANTSMRFTSFVAKFYESKGARALFQELTKHPLLPCHDRDVSASLLNTRLQFLKDCVCMKIDMVPVSQEQSATDSISFGVFHDHFKSLWSLADYWLAGKMDDLRIWFVVALYSAGYDHYAESQLHLVRAKSILASDLLDIAGARVADRALKANLESSIFVGPNLAYWLRQLEEKNIVKCMPCDFNKLGVERILGYVNSMLPPNSKHFALFGELVQLLKQFD